MKRLIRWLPYLLLAGILCLGPRVWQGSGTRRSLAAKKYEGYAGVLTLWVCEDWQCGSGSLCGWLGSCLGTFEKAHQGVYVQLIQVPRQTLTDFARHDAVPPDAMLFAPGALTGFEGVLPLEDSYPVMDSLLPAGQAEGTQYALCVAMGRYGLAINRALLPKVPADWRALDGVRQGVNLLRAPLDEVGHDWSAAVAALFAGDYAAASDEKPLAGQDMELNLATALPAPKATQPPLWQENGLPADYDRAEKESLYKDFVNGRLAAMPVTQREIRRLELLSESGRAPDYLITAPGIPYTDQLLLFAINAAERPELQARVALCRELLAHLLSEDAQRRLKNAYAFSVREGLCLYEPRSGLFPLERAASPAVPEANG